MRVFCFPAAYARYVEAELAVALSTIGRDVNCRRDDDARVRALAGVPEQLLEPDEDGIVTVLLVTTPEGPIAADDGTFDRLHAASCRALTAGRR